MIEKDDVFMMIFIAKNFLIVLKVHHAAYLVSEKCFEGCINDAVYKHEYIFIQYILIFIHLRLHGTFFLTEHMTGVNQHL